MSIMVIGGYGQVGSIVVRNLYKEGNEDRIIIAGRSIEKAQRLRNEIGSNTIEVLKLDVTKPIIKQLQGIDTLIMCLEQHNMEVLEACISAKVNYIDITPSTEIITELLTKKIECEQAGIKVILGVGIAPGLSNILAKQLTTNFDSVERIDSFLMLGVGESHGVNAVKWLINNIERTYITDGEDGSVQVKSFTGKRKQTLHNGHKHTFTRIDLADSLINRMMVPEAKCNSWFAYDVNYYTNMVRIMKRCGVFYWLRFKKMQSIYEKIFVSSMKVSKSLGIGSDQYELIIKVEGFKEGKTKSEVKSFYGRCNNEITAKVTAVSACNISKYKDGISFLVEEIRRKELMI